MNKNEQDNFYELRRTTVKKVKEILRWATQNGVYTEVTMLDINKSWGRIRSDKDFEAVLEAIDKKALPYFRIIIRKNFNLFGILYDEKVIRDMLEIAIRGIDIERKEYFIIIFMEKEYLKNLKKLVPLKTGRYVLTEKGKELIEEMRE